MGKIFNKRLNRDDQKKGLLKRLKNIEKNQNSNNNDKSKPSSSRSESSFYFNPSSGSRSESSSTRSESSKKISISDDELEWSVYSLDVANILEPKNETQTSFECLKTT